MSQAAAEAQMNAHFSTVDENLMAPGGALFFDSAEAKVNPSGVIQKVCAGYHVVRPALEFLTRFFLVPGKVKTILKTFMGLLDNLCPDA